MQRRSKTDTQGEEVAKPRTTVEIGKFLTQKIKALLGPGVKETKGSGNQKGDLDLHCNLPYNRDKNHVLKLWIEAKNHISNANAIIDRKEFFKAEKQADTYGAYAVYMSTDKNGHVYCSMKACDFRVVLDVLNSSLEELCQ